MCASKLFLEYANRLELTIINPDDFSEAGGERHPFTHVGRRVRKQINALIYSRKSFTVETTLSGRTYFTTLRECRMAGYYLVLHFIFVSDIKAAMARVRLRVATGGHDIPAVDQFRRFNRSLTHSIEAAKFVDEAYFYDNSGKRGHKLIARKIGDTFTIDNSAPPWLLNAGLN